MVGSRCAVSTCNNNYKKAKKEGSFLSLHSFPRDSLLREAWVAACRRGDKWNPQSSHICSNHFQLDDFEADRRLELWTGFKWRPKLKPRAIPTLNLPDTNPSTTNVFATKKLVSFEGSAHEDVMTESNIEDDLRLESSQNGFEVDSTVEGQTSGDSREDLSEKPPDRVKRNVIYSCEEFELYVA